MMTRMITTTDWTPLAGRCFARRYESFNLTITVVVGDEGLLVVDSRASLAEGRELLADVQSLSDLPILALVNTHQHYDHTFGNAAFTQVPVVAHESLLETLPAHAEQTKSECLRRADEDPRFVEMTETPLRLPDTTFASVWTIDLGDCYVELVHVGRGHTAGDVVVNVPGSGVLIAGDVVEQSGPPSYGEDSWPLEWAGSLDLVAGLIPADAVVVPGHGDPVDRDFIEEQRQQIVDIAEQVNLLAQSGATAEDAYDRGEWPFPRTTMEPALARAFAQWTPPAS